MQCHPSNPLKSNNNCCRTAIPWLGKVTWNQAVHGGYLAGTPGSSNIAVVVLVNVGVHKPCHVVHVRPSVNINICCTYINKAEHAAGHSPVIIMPFILDFGIASWAAAYVPSPMLVDVVINVFECLTIGLSPDLRVRQKRPVNEPSRGLSVVIF